MDLISAPSLWLAGWIDMWFLQAAFLSISDSACKRHVIISPSLVDGTVSMNVHGWAARGWGESLVLKRNTLLSMSSPCSS